MYRKLSMLLFLLVTAAIAHGEQVSPLFPYFVTIVPAKESPWGYVDYELVKWGYMDAHGKTVIQPTFSHARPFAGDYAVVQVLRREESESSYRVYTSWGVIDRTGAFISQPTFKKIEDFSEGLARASLPDLSIMDPDYEQLKASPRSGFITPKGEFIIPANPLGFKAEDAGDFSGGLAPVTPSITLKQAKKLITDRSLLEMIINLTGGDDSMTVLTSDNPVGFVNTKGELVIPNRFGNAGPFREGLAPARSYKGKYGFIGTGGDFVIKPRFDYAGHFSEGLAPVSVKERWGYVDRKGIPVIPPKYAEVRFFSEGMAAVKTKNAYGFINRAGKLVIPATFAQAGDFSSGLAAVGKKKGDAMLWGFIDNKGKTVIPYTFTGWTAPKFSDGLALVQVTVQEESTDEWNKGTLVDVDKRGYINAGGAWVYGPIKGPWDSYLGN